MPRPETDPDHETDEPHERIVRNGNSGVPQSEYEIDDDTPPPGPYGQSGDEVAPGPGGDPDAMP